MLSKNAILASSSIVEDFTKRNITVLPLPGTPLHAICSTMAPGEAVPENIEDLQQLSAENTMLVNVTEDQVIEVPDEENVVEEVIVGERNVMVHDEVMLAAISNMAEKLNFAKETARTMVLPQCRLLFLELEQRVDDLIYAPRLVPTVVMSYYPEYYTSDLLLAEIGDFNLNGFIEADRSFQPNQNLALIPGDYLRGALVTGNVAFDELVSKAVDGMSEAVFEDIYNHYFRGSMLSTVPEFLLMDSNGVGFRDTREAATAALLCWVWSQQLMDDIQEGNKVSLDNYQALMLRGTKVALNGLARIHKQRMAQIEQGELILSAPSLYAIRQAEDASDLQIFVNADTYLDYLRAGGSPEALTGSVLLEKIQLKKEELIGANDVLMRQYNEFVELKATQQSANRIRAYALALKGLFTDKIIPLASGEGQAEAMQNAVNQIVGELNDTDIINLQQFFRRLYVNVVVDQGAQSINRLVDEIDIEMRANPELTVFEAATKGMVNLLSDFVAQQMYTLEV